MKKLGFFLVGFMVFVLGLHLGVNHLISEMDKDSPVVQVQAKVAEKIEEPKKEIDLSKIKIKKNKKKKKQKNTRKKIKMKGKKLLSKEDRTKEKKEEKIGTLMDKEEFREFKKQQEELEKKMFSPEDYEKFRKVKEERKKKVEEQKKKDNEERKKKGKEKEESVSEEELKPYKVADNRVRYSKRSKELMKRAKKAEIEEIKRGYRKGKKIDKFLWKEARGDVRMYDILFDVLKDDNGNDRNIVQTDEELAKEMGITMKELRKLDKEGYFDNGNGANKATPGIGDGSPEDDAGMEFE